MPTITIAQAWIVWGDLSSFVEAPLEFPLENLLYCYARLFPDRSSQFIRSMLLRLTTCFWAFVSVVATATPLFAHPGHDAHAPQHGLFHWLSSPVHWLMMGLVAAVALAALSLVRFAIRISNAKSADGIRIGSMS